MEVQGKLLKHELSLFSILNIQSLIKIALYNFQTVIEVERLKD